MTYHNHKYNQGTKNSNGGQTMIECYHDYPTRDQSSAFMFSSNMKVHADSSAGKSSVLPVPRRITANAVPSHGIGTLKDQTAILVDCRTDSTRLSLNKSSRYSIGFVTV